MQEVQRVSLRHAEKRVKRGVLFREREHPLWNPQRKAFFHCKQAARRGAMLADATSCARGNAVFGRKSAAGQTSLAPHDSKARLRVVTTCRRFMAKPCTPHPIAQREQLFELLACNGGVKGQSPLRSLGGPRGPFSHVREWPPYPRPPARCRETVIILHNHNPHPRAVDPRACTDQDIY